MLWLVMTKRMMIMLLLMIIFVADHQRCRDDLPVLSSYENPRMDVVLRHEDRKCHHIGIGIVIGIVILRENILPPSARC